MLLTDIDAAIHGLTGHNAVLDELMRLIAADLVYGAVLVLALLWVHRDGLRAGVAVAVGALVALGSVVKQRTANLSRSSPPKSLID